jgi:hypothetical protein
VSCYGLACPAWLAWDISLDALVISFKYLMIIHSGIVLDCHLVNPPLGCFSVYSLLVGAKKEKRKKRKKERRCVVFRNKYICTLSIPFL